VWAGVRVGVTAGKKSVRGELALEGTLNGNYDSRLTVPLPGAGPTITSLGSSSALAGQSVAINGLNFGPSQGNGQVTFNGVPGAVTSWSTSTIIATVPVGASTGPVLVWLNSQPSNGLSVAIVPPPAISSVTPSVAAIGQTVTVSFPGSSTV